MKFVFLVRLFEDNMFDPLFSFGNASIYRKALKLNTFYITSYIDLLKSHFYCSFIDMNESIYYTWLNSNISMHNLASYEFYAL